MFNSQQIKKDFPIFSHLPLLTYLDSAATSLKPQAVIDKVSEYYAQYSANIHRGIYALSEKASAEYEETRVVVQKFINADRPEEIIFTRNATEAINLIASTWGNVHIGEGDEMVTTIMEHHANFVPWQQLAFTTGATLKVIDVDESYELRVASDGNIDLKDIVTKKTKILAITLVSNTLGTINPVKEIITAAKRLNPSIITVVDAAQAIPHMKVDVQNLGCDFLAFSSHKMLGPTGVGVLWGKYALLDAMPPYQYGGDMIREVALDQTTFAPVPHKFEAGTPDIAGVIGLKAAIRYLNDIGLENIRTHEKELTTFALQMLDKTFGDDIYILGPRDIERRAGIVAFTLKKIHPHDIAQILDEDHIALRAGHHCTMPLHTALHLPASTRASFYLYNTEEDVELLVKSLVKVRKLLS